MMFRLIWFLIAFNLINCRIIIGNEIDNGLFKKQKTNEIESESLTDFENRLRGYPFIFVAKAEKVGKSTVEKVDESNEKINKLDDEKLDKSKSSAIAFLDDIEILPLDKRELHSFKCYGSPCSKIEIDQTKEGNGAYTFSTKNPIPDNLNVNYTLICEHIDKDQKRECYIRLDLADKTDRKETNGTETNKQDNSNNSKHLPFIFTFLGVELLIIFGLTIAFGLSGRGPLKSFLKPDRT